MKKKKSTLYDVDLMYPWERPETLDYFSWTYKPFSKWKDVYYHHTYLGDKRIARFSYSSDAERFVRLKEKELKERNNAEV